MNLKFYDINGLFVGEKEISAIPVLEGTKGVQALKDVILAYQCNLRQGNACTKTRGEVSGSGKKPYRQKGTGMARHGEKRSPIWRGGGIVFGPKPRDFSVAINKKVKRLALERAIFERVKESSVILLEAVPKLPKPRTSYMVNFFGKVAPAGKTLVVDNDFTVEQLLSMRNMERVYTVDTMSLNAWDLVRYDNILFSERSLNTFLERIKI